MPTDKILNSHTSPDTSTPSKWENFKQNARDAVAKVLVPTAMLTWLSSSPSSAMASVTWSTASDLVTVCDATPWDDAPDHRTALLTPSSIEYSPVEIRDLKPEEILPIVWQVEVGDPNIYKYIEHLRIAETTKTRDMMRKYGAWNYSAEEYQALMDRIHVGMTLEEPIWYDNYELIWWEWIAYNQPSNHATHERRIVNSIINDANFIVQNWWNPRRDVVKELVDANPNNIYIFWNSYYWILNKNRRLSQNSENLKKNLGRSPNFLIFAAWTNIERGNWILKNKIYHEDIDGDESGVYSLPSAANWTENKDSNNHIMVTIWTNKKWDVDQTNGSYGASRFPVWFHNESLFAGRRFPYRDNDYWWDVVGRTERCATSYPNYLNVAMSGLIAYNFADIDDVDELLEMMRSTALTDYIRLDLNGDGDTDDVVRFDTDDGSYINQPETQPLHLISSGEVFRTYGMAINETGWKRPSIQIPTSIAPWQIVPISKWWYQLYIFQCPGVEINIDGEWIPFSDQYTDLIKTKNPAHLERRINGDLLLQMWYKPWDIIQWTVQAVDDTWWWLKGIEKPFTINMTDGAASIHTPTTDNTSSTLWWYSISGQKLSKRPTKPGVYIHDGKKVVIK